MTTCTIINISIYIFHPDNQYTSIHKLLEVEKARENPNKSYSKDQKIIASKIELQ